MNQSLSDRQLQILQLLANGKEGKQIARELYLSLSTLNTHIHRANQALDANNRTHAVAIALRLKLIE